MDEKPALHKTVEDQYSVFLGVLNIKLAFSAKLERAEQLPHYIELDCLYRNVITCFIPDYVGGYRANYKKPYFLDFLGASDIFNC